VHRAKELTVLQLRNKIKDNQRGGVTGKTGLMGSFGENLRREREMRGVTLQEISAATKIGVRFLECIENEDFSSLPGGIFNRGFVRAYARYLGLDEDPLLEEYQLAAKTKTDFDLSRFSPPAKGYARPQRAYRRTLWAGAIAIGLLILGFTIWQHTHQPLEVPTAANSVSAGTPPTTASASQETNPGSSPHPSATAPTEAGVLAATSSMTATPKLPPVNDADGRLVLQIAATERSWVAVDSDGKSVMQGVMDANTVKTFKADASFDVLTGNAQGVILTLNGQTMNRLGREGEVKQVHLTWKNLKQQTSD
jgi:cytoskeleton protein RodZ